MFLVDYFCNVDDVINNIMDCSLIWIFYVQKVVYKCGYYNVIVFFYRLKNIIWNVVEMWFNVVCFRMREDDRGVDNIYDIFYYLMGDMG